MLALTQNLLELTVATTLNRRKRLIIWRNVMLVYAPAAVLIPLGFITHRAVPVLVVLGVFEAFLLYAIYSVLQNGSRKARHSSASETQMMLLGAFEGYLAGLVGMDAAPIAILAHPLSMNNPKRSQQAPLPQRCYSIL